MIWNLDFDLDDVLEVLLVVGSKIYQSDPEDKYQSKILWGSSGAVGVEFISYETCMYNINIKEKFTEKWWWLINKWRRYLTF